MSLVLPEALGPYKMKEFLLLTMFLSIVGSICIARLTCIIITHTFTNISKQQKNMKNEQKTIEYV